MGAERFPMLQDPIELTFEFQPGARFDVIDVRDAAGDSQQHLAQCPSGYLLLLSHHGRVSRSGTGVATVTTRVGHQVAIHLFQTMFPADAGYRHDDLCSAGRLVRRAADRRTEKRPRTPGVHRVRPSELRQIHVNRPTEPVYFVDLDGVHGDRAPTAAYQRSGVQ